MIKCTEDFYRLLRSCIPYKRIPSMSFSNTRQDVAMVSRGDRTVTGCCTLPDNQSRLHFHTRINIRSEAFHYAAPVYNSLLGLF